MKKTILMAAMLVLSQAGWAQDRSVRASQMDSAMWSDFWQGKLNNGSVEFRQGDEIPVRFGAEGDLLETRQTGATIIGVKKTFWLRLANNEPEISLDGQNFQTIPKTLTGSITAGGTTDTTTGAVNGIDLMLKAFIR